MVHPEVDDDGSPGPPSRRGRPWGPVCGAVSLVYVMAVAADRMLLASDGATYNEVHGRLGGPLPRAVLGAIVVACLFHALDGVRRLVAPSSASGDAAGRAAVAFATGAIGVPMTVAVLWPWLGPVVT